MNTILHEQYKLEFILNNTSPLWPVYKHYILLFVKTVNDQRDIFFAERETVHSTKLTCTPLVERARRGNRFADRNYTEHLCVSISPCNYNFTSCNCVYTVCHFTRRYNRSILFWESGSSEIWTELGHHWSRNYALYFKVTTRSVDDLSNNVSFVLHLLLCYGITL